MRSKTLLFLLLGILIYCFSIQCKSDSRLLEIRQKLDQRRYDEIDFKKEVDYCYTYLEKSPNNQEAILLIADLYAHGCKGEWFNDGLWAAIDHLERYQSKRFSGRMNYYSEFLLSGAMLEDRGLQVGDSIELKCWVNKKVKVRANQ